MAGAGFGFRLSLTSFSGLFILTLDKRRWEGLNDRLFF